MKPLARTWIALLAVATGPGCTVETEPLLLLVDQNAGANGAGKVFVLRGDGDQRRLETFLAADLIQRPQDVMADGSGGYLVLDFGGDQGAGRIFRFAPDRGSCTELQIPAGLVNPVYFERAADGAIWIVDRSADPLGLGKRAGKPTGTLWRLSADYRQLAVIATGPPIMAPAALLLEGDDAYLLDADAFRVEPYDLNNGEGAVFKVHRHPTPLETVIRLQGLVSPFSLVRRPSGEFLIVDVNADPVDRKRVHGAVYIADPRTGQTRLFADHPEFADPVCGLLWQGGLLVVDANADPLRLGHDGSRFHFGGQGRGAIYRVDLHSGKTTLFFASPEFVNPLRLRTTRR